MPEDIGAVENRHEWVLAAPPDDVNTALDFLRSIWAVTPSVSALDRAAVETAVVELTGNVIEHAAADTPGMVCQIVVVVDSGVVRVDVRDPADEVDVDFAGIAMPGDSAESGRGIPMIRALVDDFSYERRDAVNHWRLVRRLRDAEE